MAAALGVAVLTTVVTLQAPSGSDHHGAAPTTPPPVPVAPSRRPSPGPLVPFRIAYRDLVRADPGLVRVVPFTYVANGGRRRPAYLEVPRWYGGRRRPALPLVIAIHGRGVNALRNLRYWGAMPAFGPFALVDPAGQGRRLGAYSWGWRGQIADLARMPALARRALPGLRLDRHRIYAVGSSMGGQETLLLVARHPGLLAGAAALDSATDMAARFRAFPQLRGGRRLQRLARDEVGGTPAQAPRAYAQRSPIAYTRRIALSGVPLQLWWSTRDRIVRHQAAESGALYRAIELAHPRAPVTRVVGTWAHSKELHPLARLPLLLERIGLLRLGPSAATDVARTLAAGRPARGRQREHVAQPPPVALNES